MTPTRLAPDSKLVFPDFTLLRASAGSGKTRALAHRYIQFVLSDRIPRNQLTNLLAITFSNNAAREMRERILKWLKAIHLGDREQTDVLVYLVGSEESSIRQRAGEAVDHILENYSDFQVRTIDSFMASVFKSSALEFGVSPTAEIVIEKNDLIDFTFDAYLRNVSAGSAEAAVFERVVADLLSRLGGETRFPWDPTTVIADTFKQLYVRLAAHPKAVGFEDCTNEMNETFERIKGKIREIETYAAERGLEFSGSAHFDKAIEAAARNDIGYTLGRQHRSNLIKKSAVRKDTPQEQQFTELSERVNRLRDELNALYARFTEFYARSYFIPHLHYLRNFTDILEREKRERNRLFIDDVGRLLGGYLNMDIVPYVYLMLGDAVHHFLIDEFQDTSPLQWSNLSPLIENALGQGGSFFAVGDTKQAIYGFRGADYRIMKDMEITPPFPSAPLNLESLDTNYRSLGNILSFNEAFFNNVLAHNEFGLPARLSGLDSHVQQPEKQNENTGYAESIVIERTDGVGTPERERIIDIIRDAIRRGYALRDIAVLAFRNNDVAVVSSWLSDADIRFLSYSNLDVRSRGVIGETASLLGFLHSPVDDHAFASFCLGTIIGGLMDADSATGGTNAGETAAEGTAAHLPERTDLHAFFAEAARERTRSPLYKRFQQQYPDLWNAYFERLFAQTGHLSIYDLTNDIYKTFALFERYPEEEASLIKFIETIKDFESEGTNSLRAFLDLLERDDTEGRWNIDTPEKINAVRLMTVHKAKGLGFRVVVVVMYGEYRYRENLHIDDEGDALNLLYINQKMTAVSDALEGMYRRNKLADASDYLNRIYVACTRAQEELYFIGIPSRKPGTNNIYDLLPERPFGKKNDRPLSGSTADVDDLSVVPRHHTRPARFDFGDRVPHSAAELMRGELIHAILSRIAYFVYSTPPAVVSTTGERLALDAVIADGVSAYPLLPQQVLQRIPGELIEFLRIDAIASLYREKRDRTAHNETEVADREGRLYRIDRLVADVDEVTVLDFKTGDLRRAEEHERQVRHYLSIVQDIYRDKRVRGVVAYFDMKTIREIA